MHQSILKKYMTKPTKPILHNGFKVRDNLMIKGRIERIFFTEVYELSDGKFLYLFTNMRPEEVIDRGKKYDFFTYLKLEENAQDNIAKDNRLCRKSFPLQTPEQRFRASIACFNGAGFQGTIKHPATATPNPAAIQNEKDGKSEADFA